MDDARSGRARQAKARELIACASCSRDSRERVGVEPDGLEGSRRQRRSAGPAPRSMRPRAGEIGSTELFRLDPATPVFGHGGWQEALDDLRVRRRGRRERLKDWRAEAPLKAIAFEPARDPKTGVDAQDVVQVHLEHRLVRRLLSRFLSQGFTSGLSRACVDHRPRRAAARRPARPPRALWTGRRTPA